MKRIENFDDYRALVDVVKMHDYRYFGLNCPTVSDEEYDAMYFALQEYEEQHADEVLPTHLLSSVTARTATASAPWHAARLACR